MKQRFSTRTRLVSALLTLAMVFTFLPFSAFAAGGVTIELSSYNFPDDAFREYLKTTFDKTGDRKLQPAERNAVKEINVSGKNIRDLYGIQFFPNLKKLDCYNNQLTSLDVHENTALEYLDCSENRLTSLDVSQNAALQTLYCYDNQLTILRQNTALVFLSCSKNRLTELDVSQNTKLEQLFCYENNLTSLDVSQNAALKRLDCENNQLTSLDVSQNPALQILRCDSNRLTSLDVSQNTALGILSCTKNQLTELDVSQNTALAQLYYDYNQLTSLQADNCTNLSGIGYDNNEYSVQVYESTRVLDPGTLPGNFDISRVRNLTGATKNADGTLTVKAGGGKVTYEYRFFKNYYAPFTLNVTWTNDATPSDGIALNAKNFPDEAFRTYVQTYFDTDGNGYLQNAERKAVTGMFADKKNLTNLKGVEHFPNLKKLYCYDNQVSSLDVSKNTALEELICYNNQLSSLDVSNNTALKKLQCYNNQLSSLDVSNNTALKELLCYQNQLTSLDVSNNTALEKLNCCQNSLTSLDVSKNTALKDLTCQKNQLTSLDVTQNTGLEYLSCGSHPLGSLDVSKNINLKTLYCEQSNLTSLDLSQNHKLEMLYAKENRLTSLDLSQTAVTTLYTGDNQIDINVKTTSRTFDLSTLPGFDVSKASGWVGGTVDGSTLKVDEGATQVTYTYDCGKSLSRDFTLNVKVVPDGTVTPPEPPVTPPEPPVTPPSGGGDGGGAVVIVAAAGAAVAGVVGYGVYNYVSGRKLQALLPEGVAAPENRAQTALLLWNTAGRPEPAEAPAFADVADPDTAKAAQWCVEQGLMKRRLNGKFAPGSSIPAYQVLNAYRKLAG